MQRIENQIKLIRPISALKGDFYLPADSLMLQIALAVSSQMVGESTISAIYPSQDIYVFTQILRDIGVKLSTKGKESIIINGNGLGGCREIYNAIHCRNSKIAFYMLAGILGSYPFTSSLTLDEKFGSYKLNEVAEPLSKMGINLAFNKLPLSIIGNKYAIPINYKMKNSSFYIKAMLFMLALNIKGRTTIIEPFLGSYNHLENLLNYLGFGLQIIQDEYSKSVTVEGQQEISGKDISIFSDVTSVNHLISAAIMIKGSDIVIKNVCINPMRIKVIELLVAMGANIEFLNVNDISGEKIADVRVLHSKLNGVTIQEIDFIADECPLIIMMAAYAGGETIIERKSFNSKLSNFKVRSIISHLRLAGVTIKVDKDTIIIKGTDNNIRGGVKVNCIDDNIIALAFLLCGFVAKNPVSIYNYESNLFRIFNNR